MSCRQDITNLSNMNVSLLNKLALLVITTSLLVIAIGDIVFPQVKKVFLYNTYKQVK